MNYFILKIGMVFKKMTTALIMAGGKGTRMDLDYEKPMIKVNGRPMISYVIEALIESEFIDKILVAEIGRAHV